jgi:hypothetical protein
MKGVLLRIAVSLTVLMLGFLTVAVIYGLFLLAGQFLPN